MLTAIFFVQNFDIQNLMYKKIAVMLITIIVHKTLFVESV
jgi:hypothetical protein